jgi:hypothetical protein
MPAFACSGPRRCAATNRDGRSFRARSSALIRRRCREDTGCGNNDVGGLDVAVNDSSSVSGIERVGDVDGERKKDFPERKGFEPSVQVLALQRFSKASSLHLAMCIQALGTLRVLLSRTKRTPQSRKSSARYRGPRVGNRNRFTFCKCGGHCRRWVVRQRPPSGAAPTRGREWEGGRWRGARRAAGR